MVTKEHPNSNRLSVPSGTTKTIELGLSSHSFGINLEN